MKNAFMLSIAALLLLSCGNNPNLIYDNPSAKVLFLHHSTGSYVYRGKQEVLSKLSSSFEKYAVPSFIEKYNKENNTTIQIEEQEFPKNEPYGWNNYPYDYYQIWIENAGNEAFKEEPTLEMLTPNYDLIVFKHCFPASDILPDDSVSTVDSEKKTLGNYKLQYDTLKKKLHEFPGTKFMVWTPPALTEATTSEENALRTQEFTKWMMEEWDEPNDNIFIWDFRTIGTEGGLFLKPEYAAGNNDPHPNDVLAEKASKIFAEKIIELVK
ncbi:MAG: hypothetical protein MI922_00995 [Bacteroidales bacterium]|nr:hypothetical protein [Bacteroidales bacterium]